MTILRAAEQRLWASVGVSPREHFVEVDLDPAAVDVRVQEVGSGQPVVFVHGASSGGASWAPLVAELSGFRCIMIDRPGCGLSEPLAVDPADIGEVERYGDRLVPAVIDALALESASVVATSYGGYFGLRGAAASPASIDRLVLFGWSVGAPMAKVPLVMRIGSIGAIARLTAKIPPTRSAVKVMLRQIGLGGALDSGRFSPEALDWFVALLRDTDTMGNEVRSSPRIIRPVRGMNPEILLGPELLARVTTPTCLLWGTDDPNGGPDIARPFAAGLANAELELVVGAGHAPWIDEPTTSAASVTRFLKG